MDVTTNPAGARAVQPVKCLLVDDREDNLVVLSALLRQDGVELLTAQSGPEALELLLVHDVALAFLDVQMPDMDGFELAELMRGSERTRRVPIIFLTAAAHDHRRVFKGYETGAVDFLYKPIEAHVIQGKADVFFRLYRQQQQLALELEERTRTLRFNELFTAALGHDLRSPLNAILGYAHAIELTSRDADTAEVARRMQASGKRMSRMIEDMIDLARARLAGGITIQRVAANLGDIVERVALEHRGARPDARIEVRRTGELGGQWDAERIAQVVSNLVGNALQHGDRAHPVHVAVDGSAANVVLFSVANAGTIPRELLPHVFEPFRGGAEHGKRSQGLGLGLYIVQQIVLAHEGTVEVRSSEGEPTLFRVALPRRAAG